MPANTSTFPLVPGERGEPWLCLASRLSGFAEFAFISIDNTGGFGSSL